MARVVLTTDLARQFTDGEREIEQAGANIRQLVRALDERYPGLGSILLGGMMVAIDGQIYSDPFLEAVEANSEVCFLPALGGG